MAWQIIPSFKKVSRLYKGRNVITVRLIDNENA